MNCKACKTTANIDPRGELYMCDMCYLAIFECERNENIRNLFENPVDIPTYICSTCYARESSGYRGYFCNDCIDIAETFEIGESDDEDDMDDMDDMIIG